MPFLKKLSTAYFNTFVFVNQKFIAEKSPSAILQLFVNDLTRLKDTPVYQKQLAIYFIVAKKCLSFRVKFCGALHYKAPQNYHRSLSPRLECLRLLLNVSDLFYPIDYLSPIPTIQLTISTFLQVARISVNILTGLGRRGCTLHNCTIAHLDPAFSCTTIKFINTIHIHTNTKHLIG